MLSIVWPFFDGLFVFGINDWFFVSHVIAGTWAV